MRKFENVLVRSFCLAITLGAATVPLSVSAATEKSCHCRTSSSGSYLEAKTVHDNGKISTSTLETFTMNGAKNEPMCQAELKKRAECGGKAPAVVAKNTKAAQAKVKVTDAQMTDAFKEVGLRAGDVVTLINKVPVKTEKDLVKINQAQEKGVRVDVQVQRGADTVDLWYEFPKAGGESDGEGSSTQPIVDPAADSSSAK